MDFSKNQGSSKKKGSSDGSSLGAGGIKEFIAQTTMIGNVIAAAASQKNSSEPLPFTDYSLFEETYDRNKLCIHLNPHAHNKYVFLPGEPIKVSIKADRKHGSHIFHPYSYTIDFSHDIYNWSVVRSYKDIKEVHKHLAKIVKTDLGRSCSDISKEETKSDWPDFPTEHDHLVTASQIDERCKKLAEYLRRLLTYPPYRDDEKVLHLLGVSPLSFVKGLSSSQIEETIQKRVGDNIYYSNFHGHHICCERLKIIHQKRWFILKDTYIVYLKLEHNKSVGYVMLCDRAFQVKKGIKAGAYHGIEIKNLQRKLVFKCKSSQQQVEWYDKIVKMMNTTGNMFYNHNLLTYGSYAPPRSNQKCRWFVNAEAYMEGVMNGLNNAKEEIYITDWWMCPELFLKRPTEDLQYRLDKILIKKAKEGVKVYVLLFKEVEFVISLLSLRTKNVLTQFGKNPNIKVLRHPEHSPAGVMLWSHHEKIVIIDQSVAFTGGIDLCFGRWDDDLHRLVDLGRRENIVEIEDFYLNQISAIKTLTFPSANKNQISTELADIAAKIDAAQTYVSDNEKALNSQNLFMRENVNRGFSPEPILKRNSKLNSEALIVAALMGNSNGFSNNINSIINEKRKLKSQTSSPSQFAVSTVNRGDSASIQSISLNELNLKSDGSRQMNLSPHLKMSTFSHSQGGTEFTFNNSTNINGNSKSNFKNSASSFKASKYLPTDFANDVSFQDLSKKEIVKQKWNQIKKTVGINPRRKHGRRNSNDPNIGNDSDDNYDDNYGTDNEVWIRENLTKEADLPVISNEGYYWNGKDYANSFVEDFKDIANFSEDQFDRTETPRMPWRDEAFVVFGESARDLARHFIQRWNQVKREKVKQNDLYSFLLPKNYTEKFDYKYDWYKEPLFTCNVQFTRSIDNWSGGLCQTENSILKAYCDLIRNAQHYVYIENQFFVTTTDPNKDTEVKNPIGFEICQRIKKAHKNKQNFRVYVVLPLLPAFDSFNAIQAIQYYNLRSIINGEYSIYKDLKASGINDPSHYITFHGMRNWSVLMGKLVHGIIYVHSKLMIVDDQYVVCGSANINDRSLLGGRDSEIAGIIKDEEFINSTLNKKSVKVGKYAFSLRQKIFKLHLGIYFKNPDRIDTRDCVCDQTYDLFKKTSRHNTHIYDKVFKCLPSDNILSFKDLEDYTYSPCLNSDDQKLAKKTLESEIKGFIVDFPLLFLAQEKSFFPNINTKEGVVPNIMWT